MRIITDKNHEIRSLIKPEWDRFNDSNLQGVDIYYRTIFFISKLKRNQEI